MIFGFYVFGTPNSKYDQYPNDSKRLLFKEFAKNHRDVPQLHIYRDGYLVYYAFLDNLSPGKTGDYFGVCLIFNQVYCSNIQQLFSVFQDTLITESAKTEALLKSDDKGNFSFPCDALYKNQAGINNLKEAFENNIQLIIADFQSFEEHFEIGNDSFGRMSLEEGNEAVNARFRKYKHIVITSAKPGFEPDFAEKSPAKNKRLLRLIVSGIIGTIGIVAVTFFITVKKQQTDNEGQQRDLKSKIEVKIKEEDEKKWKEARKNALEYFEFAQKTDTTYYSDALRFCKEALAIDPEDKEMKNLKQKIEKLIHP
jgi:hypothetical protein